MSRRNNEIMDVVGDLFSDYTTSPRKRSVLHSRSTVEAMTKQEASFASSEIDKIHELWQRAKKELQAKSRELATLKASFSRSTVEARLSKVTKEQNKILHKELQTKTEELKLCKRQLEAARKENDRWAQSYDQLNEEIKKTKVENKKFQVLYQARDANYFELESELRESESSKERLISKSIQDMRNHDEDLTYKQHMINEQQKDINKLQQENAKLIAEKRQMEERMQRLEQKVSMYEMDNHHMRNALSTARKNLEENQQRALKMEEHQANIEHLKLDCARIFKILKSTKEYQGFIEACDDLQDIGGLSYMRKSQKKNETHAWAHKKNTASKLESRKNDIMHYRKLYGSDTKVDEPSSPINGEKERLNWVPTEVLNFASSFQSQHLTHVPMDLIQAFIKQLNDIWQKRQIEKLKKLKAKHQTDMQDLKRRLNQQLSYDQVRNSSKVGRLQKSIEALRHDYLVNGVSRPNSRLSPNCSRLEKGEPVDALYLKAQKFLERHRNGPAVDYGDPKKIVEACLRTLEDISQKLHQQIVTNEALSSALKNGNKDPNIKDTEKKLEEAYATIESSTSQMIKRVRNCLHRVNSLQRLDEDYPLLLMRAFNAMMEDIELLATELENTARKQLLNDNRCHNERNMDFEAKCEIETTDIIAKEKTSLNNIYHNHLEEAENEFKVSSKQNLC